MISILIADSDLDFMEALRISLDERDYIVSTCSSITRCNHLVKSHKFDLIIIDLDMAEEAGPKILKQTSESQKTEIIALVSRRDIDKAIQAMKFGASDVFVKPLNIELFIIELEKLQENFIIFPKRDDNHSNAKFSFDSLYSKSIKMQKIIDDVRSFAKTDVNILIMGESGTGKGYLAKTIHAESPRSSKDFIEISCSAIPSTLLESELFGYERGAFTDAKETRKGLFELAHNSTLFLDEISTMDYSMQSKLLKVIEDFKFFRVGGRKEIEVNARIIAATNSDLKKIVSQGKFREDLFYRLNVASVVLPPLRDREKDIPDMFVKFVDEFNKSIGRNVKTVTPEAIDALKEYYWPGNIRELRNVCERIMVVINGDTISKNLLPAEILNPAKAVMNSTERFRSLEELEKEYIIATLDAFDGNKSKAAKVLGISRTTLISKIKQYLETS